MIDWRYQNGFRGVAQRPYAERDRLAHLSVRIRIGNEPNGRCAELPAHIFSTMPNNDDDVVDVRSAKIVEARFNYCLVTKGKERFEFAHPARAAGGKNDCGDVSHLECGGK